MWSCCSAFAFMAVPLERAREALVYRLPAVDLPDISAWCNLGLGQEYCCPSPQGLTPRGTWCLSVLFLALIKDGVFHHRVNNFPFNGSKELIKQEALSFLRCFFRLFGFAGSGLSGGLSCVSYPPCLSRSLASHPLGFHSPLNFSSCETKPRHCGATALGGIGTELTTPTWYA